jgi:hypothetical protein
MHHPLSRSTTLAGLAIAWLLAAGMSPAAETLALEEAFRQPGEDTKPWNYWYWMAGNVSKEGITRDLEAMAQAGIGAVAMGDINDGPAGPVTSLSPVWWDLVRHAVRECRRTGVAFGMFNSPGWSQSGGPWVGSQDTMRALFVSETLVKGRFQGTLPAPCPEVQDVAVLAVPVPSGAQDSALAHHPKVTSVTALDHLGRLMDGNPATVVDLPKATAEKPLVLDITLAEPMTVRSLVLRPAKHGTLVGTLQVPGADGAWTTIGDFTFLRSSPRLAAGFQPLGPGLLSVPETTSARWRLVFTATTALGEIALNGALAVTAAIEKQLGKLEFPKGGATEMDLEQRYPMSRGPTALAIPRDGIRDLTGTLDPRGPVDWTAPPGDWMLVRIGMGATGVTNKPATPQATGPEADKMSRAAMGRHFAAYVGKLRDGLDPADREAFKYVIADSWEVGGQTWTDGNREAFLAAYGYDPLPWLPTLAGRVVGSPEQSDRFLYDLRRLAADRMSHEYAGGLRDLCRSNGMTMWLENYGHWGFPTESLQYGGAADRIGSEFWYSDTGYAFHAEQHAAVSAAHLYGKRLVSAEAFTSKGGTKDSFARVPSDYKRLGDWAFSEGVNHLVLHLYIQQPNERTPGVNAWFGEMFNRNNTWYGMMPGPVGYWRRACALLQRGWRTAELAYFLGEDVPVFTARRIPAVPAGHAAIDINHEAIVSLVEYRDGAYRLPHGASFRLLVLPPAEAMRPAILRRIRDLVRQGGAVLGEPPLRSPSLAGYPACDDEVRALAKELWQGCDGKAITSVACGKGRVFRGVDATTALQALQVAPQVTWEGDVHLVWTQRQEGDARIFFIANQDPATVTVTPSFDVAGMVPELFQADDGSIRPAPTWQEAAGRTAVPLVLEPYRSVFVVFRAPGHPPAAAPVDKLQVLATCAGPWQVAFAPGRGAPASVTFQTLVPWNTRPEPAIAYFSGTATYRQEVSLAQLPSGPCRIDLGTVHGCAEVRVNGRAAGIAWTPPYQVDATGLLVTGTNAIEVRVANAWYNAMVGDLKSPQGFPGATGPIERTWTTKPTTIKADEPLRPSGLVGPVRILSGP